MPHDNYHIEGDDLQKKVYDKQLFFRLIKYLKPYAVYVIISFVLLLMVTAAELALPYITKSAVDDVIVSNKNLIVFDSSTEQAEFQKKYRKIKFKPYQFENKYFLIFPNTKLNFIRKSEIDTLLEKGNLIKKIVISDNSDKIRKIFGDGAFQEISSSKIAVSAAELKRLQKQNKITGKELIFLRYNDLRRLKFFAFLFFGIVIFQFVITYFQVYSINFAAQHAMYDLRRNLFARLEKMPLSFFDKNPVGRLVTRVTNDVRTLDELLSSGLIRLLQDLLTLAGILIMMLILNWKLALVSFSVLPVLVVLLIIFRNKIRAIYRIVRKKVAAINSALSEDISGVKIIQLFNQYNRKKNEFARINNEYYKYSVKQMKVYASFRPMIHSLRRIAVAIVLWYGGGQILHNVITLGVFMAFLSYLDRFFEPIDHLTEKFNILQAAMAGSERIFDLMDKPIEKENEKNEIQEKITKFKGEIEFKNVSLSYTEGVEVLKNISFKINAGEKVALVGHTGSGKTSIISLIAGLYPFQNGKIFIDGKEIRDYSLKELRRNIGIVQQDVFLFSGTIRENIILNNKSFSDDKLREICKYVNVDKFIENLPEKYDEQVMERGATFSVGQRQLIAFARVLAYDPAIFVLDEATSNIDTETEILIQDALKKLMENRTSIIIAHRLSTIQHVDRIIVLHKGEIREQGTHQELLAKKGLYYDLYRLQYL